MVEVPVAVALRGIDQGATVLRERRAALGLRGVRDLLRGGVFIHTRDEDLAARDEGNQLAVAAQRKAACALEVLLHQLFLCLVVDDFDVHLLRLTTNALCVDLTHVAVAQQAVVGHTQKTDRVRLEVSHCLHLFQVVGRGLKDIETAVIAFTQEHNILIAR